MRCNLGAVWRLGGGWSRSILGTVCVTCVIRARPGSWRGGRGRLGSGGLASLCWTEQVRWGHSWGLGRVHFRPIRSGVQGGLLWELAENILDWARRTCEVFTIMLFPAWEVFPSSSISLHFCLQRLYIFRAQVFPYLCLVSFKIYFLDCCEWDCLPVLLSLLYKNAFGLRC